jgi:hypothetical protein
VAEVSLNGRVSTDRLINPGTIYPSTDTVQLSPIAAIIAEPGQEDVAYKFGLTYWVKYAIQRPDPGLMLLQEKYQNF